MSYKAGPHFLQIPGPSNIPGRVLRAIERPTMDHRGPCFQDLAVEVLEKNKADFQNLATSGYFSFFGDRRLGGSAS